MTSGYGRHLTIAEARKLLDSGAVSAHDLATDALASIAEHDGDLKAFTTVTGEVALAQAASFDRRHISGEAPRSALDGVPMSLKDVLATRGTRTTCGSKVLENFVPVFDATVTSRLSTAGAVLVGKTNCDEFAMGSSTENSAWGPSSNPWDLDRVPGGSSGGSAVSVAAGLNVFSLGTDTGGSVRQPAALSGVTGLKPTYGRVSRYGLIAFASSLDQVGPFAHSAMDAALVMEVIAGQDAMDSTSQAVAVPRYSKLLEAATDHMRGLRIGVPREYWGAGVEPGVESSVREALTSLEGLGASLIGISLPNTEFALATYYIIAPAEASSNLARYDGMKYGYRDAGGSNSVESMLATRAYGFGAEVKRRIMLGTYALSAGYYDAYYKKAQQVRTLIAQDFQTAFQEVDFIVGPSTPTTAFRRGAKLDDPLAMYLSDVYTVPANLAGVPGVSVPCGFSGGLPVGLQIIGKHFDEAGVLGLAHAFQQTTQWHLKHPVARVENDS